MTQSQQNIFITGVSSGIGHALAEYYLEQGQHVYGISRRTPGDLLARDNFHFASLDLREFSEIGQTLARLLDGVSRIDLAILNSGILGFFGDLQEAPMEDLKNTLDVNLWANKVLLDELFALKLELPQVVAISSGAAVNGNRGWTGYSISKAALNMLVLLYSRERPQTHFTSFAPGIIDTAMQEELASYPADERFPSLEVLRSKRKTPEMPSPEAAAERLALTFERLPGLVQSGAFTDIRKMNT